MTVAMGDIMSGVAPSDLVHISELVTGAAVVTTILGVAALKLLARRSFGVQIALIVVVTIITALIAVGEISVLMLQVGDRVVMLELMGIAGIAGLAVALI